MDDDDEEHEFSKSIVINYFEQAQETFEQMDAAIEKRDIEGYAKLGHFLKGSSATLGLQKVQAICEKIQNSHASANEESLPEYDGDVVLKCGIELLAQLKHEYKQAEQYLCQFYEMDASIFDINNAQ
ncbi:signal transduction histidine kinase [Syncephalis plumigaleata]|nr:signal transduction histidine kinase [Syncephalis plumigaleata]